MRNGTTMNCIVTGILVLNGVYDIICALSILWRDQTSSPLWEPFNTLSLLHPKMFKEECGFADISYSAPSQRFDDSKIRFRFLAYWVLTYGVARLVAGIKYDISSDIIAAMTYFIEAFSLEYESRMANTLFQDKVTFVSVFSVVLGILVILRPTGIYGQTRERLFQSSVARDTGDTGDRVDKTENPKKSCK